MPFPEHALEAVRRRLERRPAPLSPEERAELLDYQKRLAPGGDPDPLAEQGVEALGHSDTLAVLSGQQCGLLGGPLYAFIKAAAAVSTARALQEELGRRVVPVFWLAGDDHDFEEIRSFSWATNEGALGTWSLDGHGDSPRVPAFERRFGPGDADALAQAVEAASNPTEFREEIVAFLREISAEGVTLEDHFGRLMARLFAGSGLIFATPWLGFIRRRGAKLMEREFEEPLALGRLVVKAGERLQNEKGIEPPLHRPPDAVNFFAMRGRERCRVRWSGPGPEIEAAPGEWQAVPAEALLAELRGSPENFSPNVVARPPAQDVSFPTAAYVGGPGERAYFEQLREVYEHLGVAMPWIAPRPGLTLVEPRARRSLDKLGASVAELIEAASSGPDGERALLLERDGSKPFVESVERLQSALATRLAETGAALPKTFTRSKGALDKAGQQIGKTVERLLDAAAQDAKQAAGDLERHLDKARSLLAPEGKPQERVLNLVAPFLVNYGWGLAERLRELVPPASGDPRGWRLDLPLDEASRPEPLEGASPEAKLWQGADI